MIRKIGLYGLCVLHSKVYAIIWDSRLKVLYSYQIMSAYWRYHERCLFITHSSGRFI